MKLVPYYFSCETILIKAVRMEGVYRGTNRSAADRLGMFNFGGGLSMKLGGCQ